MQRARNLIASLLLVALVSASLTAQTQRRRSRPQPPRAVAAAAKTDTRLTGLYRLDPASSDDPRAAARRALNRGTFGDRETSVQRLAERLESPDQLALERRGRLISIASTRAPRITFEADGADHIEKAADGHTVRTRASLSDESLFINSGSSGSDREDDYNVSFDSLDDGRRLRVTRRIYGQQVGQSVVVQSVYNKVSNTARFDIYQPQTARVNPNANARANPNVDANASAIQPPVLNDNRRSGTRNSPPVILRRNPPPLQPAQTNTPRNRDVYVLVVPNGTRVVATLNNDLSTNTAREGDRFTLTVREPGTYAGATIDGYVARVSRGGRVAGRAEMLLEFEQIRLRDGRTAGFKGTVEDVRAVGGEDVRANNEGGNVQESDSQGNRTAQRAAIGAAVGAIIGAIANGGKGAAIGAAIGAGAGVGSVYAQGRDDLQLRSGTELIIRASR